MWRDRQSTQTDHLHSHCQRSRSHNSKAAQWTRCSPTRSSWTFDLIGVIWDSLMHSTLAAATRQHLAARVVAQDPGFLSVLVLQGKSRLVLRQHYISKFVPHPPELLYLLLAAGVYRLARYPPAQRASTADRSVGQGMRDGRRTCIS